MSTADASGMIGKTEGAVSKGAAALAETLQLYLEGKQGTAEGEKLLENWLKGTSNLE
jgi:hypothetical protein